MMVWDVRCPAIMCTRSNTAYQAPVLAVQVSRHPARLLIMRLETFVEEQQPFLLLLSAHLFP